MRPPHTEAIARTGAGTDAPDSEAEALPWSRVAELLSGGPTAWLATVRADGAPHLVPVFAAWDGDRFFFAANANSRKHANLGHEGRCVVASALEGTHLSVEGTAAQVRDDTGLARAAAALERVLGWPTRPRDGQLDADYGAPTSGGPPFQVWAISPTVAFGFPTDDGHAPTRWRFTDRP